MIDHLNGAHSFFRNSFGMINQFGNATGRERSVVQRFVWAEFWTWSAFIFQEFLGIFTVILYPLFYTHSRLFLGATQLLGWLVNMPKSEPLCAFFQEIISILHT